MFIEFKVILCEYFNIVEYCKWVRFWIQCYSGVVKPDNGLPNRLDSSPCLREGKVIELFVTDVIGIYRRASSNAIKGPLLPTARLVKQIKSGNKNVAACTCQYQAPVPLSIFRSNSKFDENSECSSFEYTRPITTIFCTRHDSDTVVTCAKYRCDRPRIFYTRVFWIFIEFRIRSKYA